MWYICTKNRTIRTAALILVQTNSLTAATLPTAQSLTKIPLSRLHQHQFTRSAVRPFDYFRKLFLPSTINMGGGFGQLAYVRGIIKFSISPFEQRAFAGAISHGVPNMFRRFRSQVLRVVPPFVIGYLVYQGVEAKHTELGRKNPADFANDE